MMDVARDVAFFPTRFLRLGFLLGAFEYERISFEWSAFVCREEVMGLRCSQSSEASRGLFLAEADSISVPEYSELSGVSLYAKFKKSILNPKLKAHTRTFNKKAEQDPERVAQALRLQQAALRDKLAQSGKHLQICLAKSTESSFKIEPILVNPEEV